jgi:SNF2 family DNA or RNA helicase
MTLTKTDEQLEQVERLHQATSLLSAACDGALALDGAGFNKFDSPVGKSMTMIPPRNWSPGQVRMMYGLLRKYRKQLASDGFDFDSITAPEKIQKISKRTIKLMPDKYFHVTWDSKDPKFQDMLDYVRTIPGRGYNRETKVNIFPYQRDVALSLHEFVNRFGDFSGNQAAHDAIKAAIEGKWAKREETEDESRVIDIRKNDFTLKFDFNQEILDRVRELPGRRWTGEINTLPHSYETVLQLLKFANKFHFYITVDAQAKIDEITKEAQVNLKNSRAAESTFAVPELGLDLYPFQRAGVEYLYRNKKTFLADEMGLGKTVQALAALESLNAFPAVVVCPASLKYNWQREAQTWLPGRSTAVVSGKNGETPAADVVILNYDILKHHMEKLRDRNPVAVVFDESHYLKNYKALRSKAADDLVKGYIRGPKGRRVRNQYKVPHVFMLTGTPVLNRPQELLHPLSIMGRLDDFGGFWKFAQRYCVAKPGYFGTDMKGAYNLEELNKKMRLYGLYIRRRKTQVLPELPPKVWATIPVKLSNRKKYNKVQENTSRWFADRAIEDEDFLASIEDLSDEEQKIAIKERHKSAEWRANNAKQLTKIAALKQVAAEGKLKAVENWIQSFLESGEKLVIFAHHTRIVKAIAKKFDAPAIMGETPASKRQNIVDAFQNDPDVRILVANLRAGGVGLTLTAASNVLFVEFGWTPADMDQAADRCHRIGQEDSVTAWQMVGIDTIDERIVELIEDKRTIVDAATDGTLVAGIEQSVMKELIRWLEKQDKERNAKRK